MQFNVQIVSYMAEQLVHKASINGNLKFACEFLKKKYNDTNSDNDNSLLIECSRLGPNKAITSPQSPINQQDNIGALESMNEQDEKIFKLASELLLSDENVLRKMSSQVLNEAQHLTQLNWVLNTLRKLRWKHLKLKSKDKLEQVLNNLKKIESTGSINYDSNVSETDSESESDSFNQRNKSTKANTSDLDGQLDVILEVIKEIFIQHKTQISEQLSEVQKLMSIAPDDDLLTHLQNENSLLQQEIHDLKQQSNKSSDRKTQASTSYITTNWLTGGSNSTSSLRKFSSSNSFPSKLLPTTNAPSDKNSLKLNQIITDLMPQDDTVC